ncbi:hypothetical protein HHK36_004782 [Tetracentron sinense]|uniref:Glycosyltransferase n=1 Tax=Tetracentron sinense TaxID=13715 RepID=A0A834ZLW4_TETSI|nr:hypothetical protein HHK36_004782 [Tetracentron sinense]
MHYPSSSNTTCPPSSLSQQTMPLADQQDSSTKLHVIVLAFPFTSHAASLHTLVRKLAAAAQHVTFSFFNTAKSNSSILGLEAEDDLDNLKAYTVADGVPENYVFTGKRAEDIELFIKATPGNFKRAIEMAIEETRGLSEKKISCVMSDTLLWFAGEIAEEMKVPWLSLWMGAPFSLSSHFYTDLIRGMNRTGPHATAGREDEPLNFIPGMSGFRIGDLPEGILSGELESPSSIMLHRMAQMMPRAAAIAINSFEELNPTITDDLKSKFQKCLTVGPISLMSSPPSDPDENRCLSWLDEQKTASVAYVGFGTVFATPPHEQAALAEALEASGVPFLWSLKESLQVSLPEGFLDRTKGRGRGRGRVVSWVPQLRVLEHPAVGVFVTHCGWNSVLESVMGRVPMICRPFFTDQRLNRRMVEEVWGIGVGIEGGVFTRDGTMRILNLILSGEKGKKMREKLGVLKELMGKAVGPQGSSSKNFKTLLEIVSKV